ncbi:CsbD family protein [Gynuella sp.]|uniref:CsbD family protein n=1 Tax=Gynuella sp. TaxID=2969146 RepID=UPI003D152BB0
MRLITQQQQQQQQSTHTNDEIKSKWKKQVGAAKTTWSKLTEGELTKVVGHQTKLTGLVQERYAITREDAEKQVKKFFAQNK